MSPRAGVSAVAVPSAFVPFSESALQEARDSGVPVFVDVTAAWCLTCQVNKKTVLETAEAQALFAKHGVLLLRADWTTQDPRITKYLASFGRSGVPMYVYYAPGKEGVVLPELLRMGVLESSLGTPL
jgi:thiol:disulfide interchange protein DsbD